MIRLHLYIALNVPNVLYKSILFTHSNTSGELLQCKKLPAIWSNLWLTVLPMDTQTDKDGGELELPTYYM